MLLCLLPLVLSWGISEKHLNAPLTIHPSQKFIPTDKIPPWATFSRLSNPQFCQLLFMWYKLQYLNHLCGPFPAHSSISNSLFHKTPDFLTTRADCWLVFKFLFTSFCSPGPLLPSCFPHTHSKPSLQHQDFPLQLQNLTFSFVELHEASVSPFLQPINVPLCSISTTAPKFTSPTHLPKVHSVPLLRSLMTLSSNTDHSISTWGISLQTDLQLDFVLMTPAVFSSAHNPLV